MKQNYKNYKYIYIVVYIMLQHWESSKFLFKLLYIYNYYYILLCI